MMVGGGGDEDGDGGGDDVGDEEWASGCECGAVGPKAIGALL